MQRQMGSAQMYPSTYREGLVCGLKVKGDASTDGCVLYRKVTRAVFNGNDLLRGRELMVLVDCQKSNQLSVAYLVRGMLHNGNALLLCDVRLCEDKFNFA